MSQTANYSWEIGYHGKRPWWEEWENLWTEVDTELYKRTKDLYMGGKIVYGAETDAGNLLLKSTSHANKGKIYLGSNSAYDEVNDRLGIGLTNPAAQLQVTKDFDFPLTTGSTVGIIKQGSNAFIHTYADPTSEGFNIFIGQNAGNFTLGPAGGGAHLASYLLAIGVGALGADTTGTANVAIGRAALAANTTGSYNLALGSSSLVNNTTGSGLTAIGESSLGANTTGQTNVGLGMDTLRLNTEGQGNTAIGTSSLFNNLTSNDNVAIGWNALYSNTGPQNTGIGKDVLYNLTTGWNTVAIGYRCGLGLTTGINNTLIGANVTVAANLSNSIVIADGAGTQRIFVDENGKVGIGDLAPGEMLDVAGNINATGVIKIDDVQVISSRVVDARISNIPNSGDGNTDDLIDAIRDAMISHGLIAAA